MTERLQDEGTKRTPPIADGEFQERTISGVKFVRLWGQHILPNGRVRFRRVGLYAGRCQAQLAHCRKLWQLAGRSSPRQAIFGARKNGSSAESVGEFV